MEVIDKLRAISEAVVKVRDAKLKADLQDRILDLQGDCFTLQEKNAALLEENGKLKGQLQQVEDRQQLLAQLKHERNAYWKDDKPYCVACVHRERPRLIPLSTKGIGGVCPECKTQYECVFGDRRRITQTGGRLRSADAKNW